jgi:hypothetical protein
VKTKVAVVAEDAIEDVEEKIEIVVAEDAAPTNQEVLDVLQILEIKVIDEVDVQMSQLVKDVLILKNLEKDDALLNPVIQALTDQDVQEENN